MILVPEGSYHIVSHYGDGNSVVRSDIRVQTGKLIDAVVTHRAAIITLKLVSQYGGEARANTQWSVLTPGGDVVKESIGAFPRVILAEGEYRAVARNDEREALRAHFPGRHRRRPRGRGRRALTRTVGWVEPFARPNISQRARVGSRRTRPNLRLRQRRDRLLDALRPALLIGRQFPFGLEPPDDLERAPEARRRIVAGLRQPHQQHDEIDLPLRVGGVAGAEPVADDERLVQERLAFVLSVLLDQQEAEPFVAERQLALPLHVGARRLGELLADRDRLLQALDPFVDGAFPDRQVAEALAGEGEVVLPLQVGRVVRDEPLADGEALLIGRARAGTVARADRVADLDQGDREQPLPLRLVGAPSTSLRAIVRAFS